MASRHNARRLIRQYICQLQLSSKINDIFTGRLLNFGLPTKNIWIFVVQTRLTPALKHIQAYLDLNDFDFPDRSHRLG